jgi:arylsulfatase A-like enzyme
MRLNRRAFLKQTGLAATALAAGRSATGQGAPRKRPPNIVVIFTDDQGYNDVGCFGSPNIKTPNLDRMAAEGMKLTDFYSAASVCTPSRAALLTGCYPPRVSLPGVLFPRSNVGLHADEITLAELLKGRGYATTCIGKWHLGHHEKFLPTRHGFDHYFGIPYSNDMWLASGMDFAEDANLRTDTELGELKDGEKKRNKVPLMRDEQVVEYPADQATLTKRYTEEAVRFITANEKRPFFLYLPHTMPHVPIFASEKFKGTSDAGLYGDVIEEIDWSTGQILDTLKTLDLANDTLVFFTSDNGPWLGKGKHGGSAKPLRAGKFTTWEGGMREPAIAWWPGTIPAGSVCSEVAGTIDFLPTFARLAGAKVPDDRVIDGKDIWPLLAGKEGATSPHEAYYYFRGNGLQAVRSGKWKLRLGGKKADTLYDLRADISEQNNVADEHPEVVERLAKLAEQMRQEIRKNRSPHRKL